MAGESNIAKALEKLVKNSANLVGNLQLGVNKILWGASDNKAIQTVKYNPGDATTQGKLVYTTNMPAAPTPPKNKVQSLINTGLFNALDALNSVDLCNVLMFVVDNFNQKKTKRKRSQNPTAAESALYFVQDQAAAARVIIDKYTAFPNTFVSSYTNIGLNPQSIQQAVQDSNAPSQGGSAVTAYNTYFLMQSLKDVFENVVNKSGVFSPEEQTLLAEVPGLAMNLGIVKDFLGTIDKYSSYTQISNAEVLKLQKKISTIRAVCVVVENLDFKSALALAGNFLNTDIRAQVQKLSKYVDPTRITDTLKQINSALQSFIRIGKQVQGILNLGQYVIKVAILFIKIFRFIVTFFTVNPLPSLFTTAGIQSSFELAKEKAKDESGGVLRTLRAINALLAVLVVFIRYILANTNELLIRLEKLLAQLKGCKAVEDSDIIKQLEQTQQDLITLRDELGAYITKYDSKTDPNTAMFGAYDIRVVEEEAVDPSVRNKRRRGIALNISGEIVAASDLTFATNTAIIIEEVKQKLLSLKLIQPTLGVLNGEALGVISDSLNYLDNNDVLQDDLNVQDTLRDAADNLDESQGIGLNAFINKLPGGRKLRLRTRAKIAENNRALATQLRSSDPAGQFSGTLVNKQLNQANQLDIENLKSNIDEWKKEIAAAALLGVAGTTVVVDRTKKISEAKQKIAQLQQGT